MTKQGSSKTGGNGKRNEKNIDCSATCTNFKVLSSRSFSLLNKLANLCIALFYAYTFLHDTLKESSAFSWYVKQIQASIADTQTRAQTCFDYIFLHGKSLVLLEEPTLSKIDLNAVSKLEKEIQDYLAKLEEMANKENDKLLLDLVTKIHSVCKLGNINNVSYQYKKGPPSIVITAEKSTDVIEEYEDTGYFGSTINEEEQTATSTPAIETHRNDYWLRSKHNEPSYPSKFSIDNEDILFKWKEFRESSLDSPGQPQTKDAGKDISYKIDSANYVKDRHKIQDYDIEIHQSDMPQVLLEEIIQIYIKISNKMKCKSCGNEGKDVEVAKLMKAELDANEEIQEWMVIVGEKYGVVVTHQNQTFANFTSNSKTIVVSKPN